MRSAALLFGTLALVGLVCKFWWLIALVLAAVVLWTHIPGWWAGHQATVAGRDSLSWPQEDGLRWLRLRGGGVSF